MNVNFEYYKIFYYVAKYGNLTKAAHALSNNQPNITRAMNCLEHELNCTLFIRTNRGVCLTQEGKKLYERVSVAMAQLQMAEEELADNAELKRGNVSLSVSDIALNIYLLERLKTFHMTYPGVRLKISNHSSEQAVRSVRSGETDFAVITAPVSLGSPLKEIRLRKFQEILVGGPSFASLVGRPLSIRHMVEYPFICLGKETATSRFYQQIFLSHGAEFAPDTEAATADQVLSLVKSELGLAFLPKKMAEEAIRKQEILAVPLEECIPEREVCMVYDSRRPVGIAAQKLRKLLIEGEENKR